ncbi:hypothetical protein HMPREF0322_03136 [Desulfitobacterium hafniense DP7]|uniref:Uncharacterized protein n=1 Tax=Desulfitobacterium hafniense DP7 TaxID=537010 RepID=G9XQ90_DESHA|nr:hypothetical protein HMPREF0322_03136 [Desulfitobacterium hafniense DP7]
MKVFINTIDFITGVIRLEAFLNYNLLVKLFVAIGRLILFQNTFSKGGVLW